MYEYFKRLLNWSFYLSYLLYGLTLIGIYNVAPEYLHTLNLFIKIYVALFLIIYFSPFTQHKINEFDKNIVFTAGIFLLMTTAVADLLHPFMERQLNEIKHIKNKVNEKIIKNNKNMNDDSVSNKI